jgi:uncharacterized protein with HEPN domain/predicted nucleotidyltransferase
MERSEVIAKLKQHEAELKRLGVEHLYLFGSTARGEARVDSDVDLFFDHPEGSLGLFELMDVKDAAARILGAQNRHHDAAQLASGSARADRGLGSASVLMAEPSPVPRLTDIIEAVELIRSEMAGVTLKAFEPDRRKRWLVERGIEIISEASRHLPDDLKSRHPEIPWPKVAGIGNVLRHDYKQVAHDVLWHVVHDDLPPLERSAARNWRGCLSGQIPTAVAGRRRRKFIAAVFLRSG